MQQRDAKTKALNKAKVGIMSRHNSVFISTVLFNLKFSWDNSIPTACTNGAELKVNEDFFMALEPKERIGLLAHEAWHVAFDHMARMENKDHTRFNKAADHVINLMLLDAGYAIPAGGLHDPQYKGMSADEVYRLLPEEPQDGSGQAPGGTGMDIVPYSEGAGDPVEKQEEVSNIISSAATASASAGEDAGELPGDVTRLLKELHAPKLNWRTILANYMSEYAKEDYSYTKPNRRYAPEFYLPSMYSESLSEICVAVDTSGSVSDEEFSAFLTEIREIKENMQPKKTTIIDFDTSVKNVYELTADQGIDDVVFNGYGGTRLAPVFEHYKEEKPTVLIVFSDLYCTAMEDDPGYPVIWVVVNNPGAHVNFGDKIDYDTSDL